MLAGMAMRPAATPARMNSGSRPSLRATSAIWGVTTPARAKSIWVTGCADAYREAYDHPVWKAYLEQGVRGEKQVLNAEVPAAETSRAVTAMTFTPASRA